MSEIIHRKFVIYGFDGRPKSHWTVDEEAIVLTGSPVEMPIGAAQYQVLFNTPTVECRGSSSGLTASGTGDAVIYRFREVGENEYFTRQGVASNDNDLLLVLARAKLAEGKINEAKSALYSSWAVDIFNKHSRALTSSQVASLDSDIVKCLGKVEGHERKPFVAPKAITGDITILDLVRILEDNRDGISLDFRDMCSSYRHKGIKTVPGVKKEDGTVEQPWLEIQYVDDGVWVPMGTFKKSRNSATINMMIARKARLVKTGTTEVISSVAGIGVDPSTVFRNFTMVDNGEVTIPAIRVKFSSARAYEEVRKTGILGTDVNFDPEKVHVVPLGDIAVSPCEFTMDISGLHEAYRQVLADKVMISILSAVTKDKSSEYTPEQAYELKRHYLSKGLIIDMPTVREHDDINQAILEGKVETRVSHKVDVGDVDLISSGRLKSANEFLDRHFVAQDVKTGQPIKDKPKMDMFLDPKYVFAGKQLSAKVKITAADEFCKPIFEDFLGISPNGRVNEILARAGVQSVMDIVRGGSNAMMAALRAVEGHQEKVYSDKIIPLVFFIGASGLMPDCLDAKPETADSLEVGIPGLKLSKDEREGTFFRSGDVIISLYSTKEYCSTGKK